MLKQNKTKINKKTQKTLKTEGNTTYSPQRILGSVSSFRSLVDWDGDLNLLNLFPLGKTFLLLHLDQFTVVLKLFENRITNFPSVGLGFKNMPLLLLFSCPAFNLLQGQWTLDIMDLVHLDTVSLNSLAFPQPQGTATE